MIAETDVLILGCGIAGCVAALELAHRGADVLLISSGEVVSSTNSYRAQGGIATQTPDEPPESLKDDILKAGDGLCYERAVDFLIQRALGAIQKHLGDVPFDAGYAKEGAHTHSRVLYQGDQSGKAIMDVLSEKVHAHPRITFRQKCSAIDLITLSHHSKDPADLYQPPTCCGAYLFSHETQSVETVFSKETILATGGVGECFLHTSNGKEACGDGIAMAFRAGVRIMNMEYIQFHPTTLYIPDEPRFLLTEALRGEGGHIIELGDVDPLAPRDILARAIFKKMIKENRPHLSLDMTHHSEAFLRKRFPTIYQRCLEKGLNMSAAPLPIVPAAHYCCGGVAVDLQGQTSMRRLRAIGEVACTGVHGANRLASTALLEGLVWGESAAQAIDLSSQKVPDVALWKMGERSIDQALVEQDWIAVKQTLWNYVGLLRSHRRLKRAFKMLSELKWEIDAFYESARITPDFLRLRNGCQTALLITQGALKNEHSRGSHYYIDSAPKAETHTGYISS